MSHLTVPQSTKNPRRTRVPRQKAVPLAKASTFNAPRCLLTPVDSDEEEEELEKLEKDRLHTSDSVMANNQGNDGGDEKLSQKIDQKIDALRLPVLSVSRVMTRSHTDTRALENAVTEGSRTVDLWERLERLRLDEKNTESKEKQRAHDDRRRSNGSSGASNTASPSASGSETDTETGSDSDDEQHENLNANSGSNSANLPTLSVIACRKIESHVLLPLLRRKELTCFQPLIRSLPPRMQSGEIATLRDLEKTLLSMSVNFAISNAIGRNVYTAFAHYAIQCLHSTVPMLCDRELKKQHERAYNGLYFLDLVEQVRQYAAIVGHARIQRAAAAVVKRAEEDMEKAGFESDDEIILVNGIANEGRPAELVRRKKDGSMFSLSTGKPYHVPEQSSEKDMQKRSWTLPKASESRCPARPNQGEHTRDPFPHSAARRATLAPQIAASLIRRKFGQSQSCSGPRAPLALLEPGTKRPSLTFTPEPPSDVSRSMARRKKNEPPMNINKKCEHCDKVFRRRCDYTKHSKTHSRPFKCPVIGCRYNELGWPTEKEKDRHYNDKHCTEPILHHCKYPNCTYKSKRESNCKQHMEKAHGWCYVRTKQKNSISGPTKKVTAHSHLGEHNRMTGGRAASFTPSTTSSSSSSHYAPSPSPGAATPASGIAPVPQTPGLGLTPFGTPMGAPVSTAASSSGNTSATSATPEFGSDFDSTPASSAASSAGQSVHNFNADEYKQQEHADGNGDNSVDDFTLFPRQAQGQQQSAGNASSAGEAANLNAKDTAERAPASAPQTSNYAFMDNNDAFAAAAAAAGLDFGNVDFNMNFQDINVNGLFNDMNMDMDMNTAAFPNGNLMGMEGNGNSVPAAGTGRNNNNGYGNESNLGQMDAALGMMFMDNMDIDTTPMEAEFVQFQQQFLQGDANANPQPLNTGANNEDWSSANMKWDEQRYPFNTTGYQSTATQQQQQQQQYHGANNNDPNNKFGSMSSSASMSPPSLGNSPSSLASTMSLSDIFDVNSHQNVQGRRHKHHQYHRGSTQRNDLFADFDAFMVKPGVEADGQEMLRPRQDSNSHSPVSPRAANDDTVSPLGGRGNLDTTLYSAAVAECSQPTSQQEMLDLKARLNPSTAMNGEPLNGVDGGELTPTPTRRESAPSRQLPQQLNKQQWRSQRANSSIEIGLGNGNGSAFGSQSQQQHAAGMPSFNEDEFVNYGPASVASQSQQLAQPAFDMTTLFV